MDSTNRDKYRLSNSFARFGLFLSPLIMIAADYLTIVLSLIATYHIRRSVLPAFFDFPPGFSIPQTYVIIVIPGIHLLLMALLGMYSERWPFWKNAEQLFKASAITGVLVGGVLFAGHIGHHISRTFIFTGVCISFFALLVERVAVKRILAFCNLWTRPLLMVGGGKSAGLIAEAYRSDPNLGFRIVGLINDGDPSPNLSEYPLWGGFESVGQAIRGTGIRDVLIAAPDIDQKLMNELIFQIQPLVSRLYIIPDLYGLAITNIKTYSLFGQKTMVLGIQNNLNSRLNRMAKYSFDVIACLFGAVLFVPVYLILALLIRIDSPGPILFAHPRYGSGGRVFKCYKFRTMVRDAGTVLDAYLAESAAAREEWGRDHKLRDDPRVTRIGRFLRRTSLDELPQIFNVLKGDMSLVGPRPIVKEEISKYGLLISDYFLVRPGITGFWQVSGRNNVDYDSRVQMDSWYVRNWAFWLDVDIIVKTVKVVLKREGAY